MLLGTMATRRPNKPLKTPTASEEARGTNVLLEALGKEVTLVAEGVVDLQRRLTRVEEDTTSLPPLRDEVKSIGDIVRTLAKNLQGVTFSTAKSSQDIENVKTELRLIRSDLTTFDKRLTTVEEKLPA